jgi:hypothetical protein
MKNQIKRPRWRPPSYIAHVPPALVVLILKKLTTCKAIHVVRNIIIYMHVHKYITILVAAAGGLHASGAPCGRLRRRNTCITKHNINAIAGRLRALKRTLCLISYYRDCQRTAEFQYTWFSLHFNIIDYEKSARCCAQGYTVQNWFQLRRLDIDFNYM